VNTLTKEKTYGTLIMFPSLDPPALVAMKAYIDAVSMEKDVNPRYVDAMRREYERLKRDLDGFKEYAAWGKGEKG
jgi:hypothetical protein